MAGKSRCIANASERKKKREMGWGDLERDEENVEDTESTAVSISKNKLLPIFWWWLFQISVLELLRTQRKK